MQLSTPGVSEHSGRQQQQQQPAAQRNADAATAAASPLGSLEYSHSPALSLSLSLSLFSLKKARKERFEVKGLAADAQRIRGRRCISSSGPQTKHYVQYCM